MNSPIYPTTLKIVSNLKNSKGTYSEKNQLLVDIASKCLTMKGFGCNFIIPKVYGKDGICVLKNGEHGKEHNANKILRDTEIANFLLNLSLTFTDRAFVLTYNANEQLIIFCIDRQLLKNDILISDKNSSVSTVVEVLDIFNGTKETVEKSVSKGKRILTENDILEITTAFNAMLGKGYNKPLATIAKKVKEA